MAREVLRAVVLFNAVLLLFEKQQYEESDTEQPNCIYKMLLSRVVLCFLRSNCVCIQKKPLLFA